MRQPNKKQQNKSTALIAVTILLFAATAFYSCKNMLQQNSEGQPSSELNSSPLNSATIETTTPKETFQGQELKIGEKIIKMKWKMEKSMHMKNDFHDGHYASSTLSIPSGKKWILLYAREDNKYKYSTISLVPYIADNTEIVDVGYKANQHLLSNSNINLARAKDENLKLYSRSKITGLSRREINDTYGTLLDYQGEMWFLEVNE